MNPRGHGWLVAIDSDGSVFPNMPAKYEAMRDTIIGHFGLEPVAQAAADAIRFVNLESRLRGSHRFVGLLRMSEFLRARPEPAAAGVDVPRFDALRRYLDAGGARSNDGLAAAAAETGDPELARVVAWTRDLSARLAKSPHIPPVAAAVRAMTVLRDHADLVVISQAPAEQLHREWSGAGIEGLVRRIAGSEAGTKTRQVLAAMAETGASPAQTLVVGDAPGDFAAARETKAGFFPILPGREEASWSRLLDEAWPRCLAGGFDANYAGSLVDEFLRALPESPPWSPLPD